MALTPIDFPDNPETGDTFDAPNGVTYTFYNNRWNGKVTDVILTVPPDEVFLDDLADVCADPATAGQYLVWDDEEDKWCPADGPSEPEGIPDGMVTQDGHYENGAVVEGITFSTDISIDGVFNLTNADIQGLNLDDLSDVNSGATNGQILEYSNGFWRPIDTPTGGSELQDLSPYTKRNDDEVITGDWKFEERTQIAGLKVVSYNSNSFIHFYEDDDWSEGKSADVALELDKITYNDGVTLNMLDLKGGGLQILPLNSPPTKRGGLNLFPTGIDLWRDGTSGGTAHIDFKTANTDVDSPGGFDVRMILNTFTYGAGDTHDMLRVLGGGMQIINGPDAPIERQGAVNILPKGIDLITPALAGGYYQAHIDFKNEATLAGWDARISLTGEPGKENLAIRCKRELIFQDQTGRYTLAQLVGGSGGGGSSPVYGFSYPLAESGGNVTIATTSNSTSPGAVATKQYVDDAVADGGGGDVNGTDGVWDVTKPINGTTYPKSQLRQALQAIETATNGSYNTIVIPRGRYTHDQPTTYSKLTGGTITGESGQTWVTLTGDGTLGQSHINLSNNKNVIRDIQFRFSNVNNSRQRLKFLSMGSRSNWDTDGIIINCVFTASGGAAGWKQTNTEWDDNPLAAVHYYGRNLKMHECSFTVEGTCVIVESSASNSEPPYKNTPQGFRKFEFTDNRIHSCERFLAVQGNAPLRGATIADNQCDSGAQLLFVDSNGGVTDSAITGNVCVGGDQEKQNETWSYYSDAYIYVKRGRFNRNAITGNTLNGWSDDFSYTPPTDKENMLNYAIKCDTAEVECVAITGNTLGWVKENIIRFATVKGLTVTGNAFSPSGVVSVLDPTSAKTKSAVYVATDSKVSITANTFRTIASNAQFSNLATFPGQDTNVKFSP